MIFHLDYNTIDGKIEVQIESLVLKINYLLNNIIDNVKNHIRKKEFLGLILSYRDTFPFVFYT